MAKIKNVSSLSLENLNLQYPNSKLILLGDYNLPNVVWKKADHSSYMMYFYNNKITLRDITIYSTIILL